MGELNFSQSVSVKEAEMSDYLVVRERSRFSRGDALRIGIATATAATLGLVGSPASALTKMPIAESGVTLLYLYVYVGIDQGFFKQEGLDIDLFTAGSGG